MIVYYSREKFLALTILFSLPFVFSCTKTSDGDDDIYAIVGNASGLQEKPANSSTASATLSGTYDAENNTLEYKINWKNLSGFVTAAHFHATQQKGDSAETFIEIKISVNGIDGSAMATVVLSDAAEAELLNGDLYYDIKTALYPNGEIRGQVIALRD
jgi:hypothetical protein